MDEVRVVNASPLITLAKVSRLDLLSRGGQRLVVPRQVADEVLAVPNAIPRVSRCKVGSARPSTRQLPIPKFSAGVWALVNRQFYRPPGP